MLAEAAGDDDDYGSVMSSLDGDFDEDDDDFDSSDDEWGGEEEG